jgi:outer membrane protein OmpA-like peptidoglycan-associated protein
MRSLLPILFLAVLSGGSAAIAQQSAPDSFQYPSRFNVAGGYNFIDANAPPGSCQCFTMNGAFVSGDFNLNQWLGVAGEITAGHATNISSLGQNLTLMTFLAGPRVSWRHGRFTPFAEFLLGGVRGTGSYFPTATSSSSSASGFSYSTGGGLDVRLTERFGIRAFDFQFLRTDLPNGKGDAENQLQVSTGVVFHFGGASASSENAGAPPMIAPKQNAQVQFGCSVSSQEVAAGDAVQIVGEALTVPEQHDLDYAWTSNAGAVQGQGRMVTIDTKGLAPGNYRVDGRVALASDPSVASRCQVSFRVSRPASSEVAGAQIIIPPGPEGDDFRQHVRDLFFSYDSARLRPEEQAVIAEDAAFLQTHPQLAITIAGYADERGSDEYNQELGTRRAASTMEALAAAGIDRSRMHVLSYGKNKPFCTEETDSCQQRNRRAQLLPDAK